MMRAQQSLITQLGRAAFWCLVFSSALSGCTVISVTTSAVGLAADAAIGTVKIVGKGVGKAADALLGDDDKDDGSGITIRYRESNGAPLTKEPSAAPMTTPASGGNAAGQMQNSAQ